MGSNQFGKTFQITTFGESHGPGVGVVIDGCPANLPICKEEIEQELAYRQPGKNPYTSPRKEKDDIEIFSGVFEGKTTGAPIAILIRNQDADSSQYEEVKHLLKPGHAQYTYLNKYGIFDYRGGGRASARETVARVAAGAVAKKLLKHFEIEISAFIEQVGEIKVEHFNLNEITDFQEKVLQSPIFCPCPLKEKLMMEQILILKEEGDSMGGIVRCIAKVPIGLGDPVYAKLEANLSSAMLSIPASKGFSIGSGFSCVSMKGSEHNDPFSLDPLGKAQLMSNHAGGVLAGISTGERIDFQVAFKPTSSIQKPQKTVDMNARETTFKLPVGSRHDPCVAIRAVPVVSAMCAIVLADALLQNRLSQLSRQLPLLLEKPSDTPP